MRPWTWPLLACALAAALGAAAPARGQLLARPQPRAHEGLFLRVSVGVAYQSLLAPDRGIDFRAQGAAATLGGHIGLSVERNLVLHMSALYWDMPAPRFTADGRGTATGTGRISAFTLGPGLTYFLPHDFHVSASLGIGFMFLVRPEGLDDARPRRQRVVSDGGWTFSFGAGKEWWVDDEWALGFQVALTLANFPEPTDLPVWGGPGVGLRLVATFD